MSYVFYCSNSIHFTASSLIVVWRPRPILHVLINVSFAGDIIQILSVLSGGRCMSLISLSSISHYLLTCAFVNCYRWKTDDAKMIIDGALAGHKAMIKQAKGMTTYNYDWFLALWFIQMSPVGLKHQPFSSFTIEGIPGVLPERYEEGLEPRHCALSLVGVLYACFLYFGGFVCISRYADVGMVPMVVLN